jgi:hypothetical protein
MKSLLRKWNCVNCGRSNRTLVAARTGIAECEYCTDVARVHPLQPFGSVLFRYAASVLASLTGGSGCIQWRPVLARARVPMAATLIR